MAPEVAQIPVEIADILLKQNNCQEAVAYLRVARDSSPDDLEVKTKLAECLMNLQEYQEARNMYEELALQMPGNAAIVQRLEEVRKKIFIENLPSEYQSIPHTAEATRSQLAAYFIINLEMLQKYRSDHQPIVVDIIQHWAQSYIQKVVTLGM